MRREIDYILGGLIQYVNIMIVIGIKCLTMETIVTKYGKRENQNQACDFVLELMISV